MRLNPMGSGGAAAAGGFGAAALVRPSAPAFQSGSGLASNRASYNTLDMAQREPMSHSNSGYYDHDVSFRSRPFEVASKERDLTRLRFLFLPFFQSNPYSDGGHTPPGPNSGYNSNYAPVGGR